jgi:hypothetical protein
MVSTLMKPAYQWAEPMVHTHHCKTNVTHLLDIPGLSVPDVFKSASCSDMAEQ